MPGCPEVGKAALEQHGSDTVLFSAGEAISSDSGTTLVARAEVTGQRITDPAPSELARTAVGTLALVVGQGPSPRPGISHERQPTSPRRRIVP